MEVRNISYVRYAVVIRSAFLGYAAGQQSERRRMPEGSAERLLGEEEEAKKREEQRGFPFSFLVFLLPRIPLPS